MITLTPAPSTPGCAQPAKRDREGGEAEIGLGLAAAGREEQQVDDLALRVGAVRSGPHRLSRMNASWNGRQAGWRSAAGSPLAPAIASPRRRRDRRVHDRGRPRARRSSSQNARCRARCGSRQLPCRRSDCSAVSRRRSARPASLSLCVRDPGAIERRQRLQGTRRGRAGSLGRRARQAPPCRTRPRCERLSSFGATRSTSAVGIGSVQTQRTLSSPRRPPSRRGIAADRVFADVAIVEVGEPQVVVVRAHPDRSSRGWKPASQRARSAPGRRS